MKPWAIEVEGVSKTYQSVKAVDNLSFQVEEAGSFGLLGPNGAGKSTMMRMLYNKTLRDEIPVSKIHVLGFDPQKQELAIKYISGIVPQEDNLDQELSVKENLLIYAKLYGMDKKTANKRIDELLDFMELAQKQNEIIKHLSGGMKRRLVIVRALINQPKLLFLDEPTTGLDPQVRHIIWDKIRFLKKNGVTVLLTTHYMEEASQICDQVLLLHNGQKLLQGNPKILVSENIEKYVMEMTQFPDLKPQQLAEQGMRLEKTEQRLIMFANDYRLLEGMAENLHSTEFFIRQANLEDLFLKVTGRSLDE